MLLRKIVLGAALAVGALGFMGCEGRLDTPKGNANDAAKPGADKDKAAAPKIKKVIVPPHSSGSAPVVPAAKTGN